MGLQTTPEVLPCGCKVATRIVDGEKQFVMEPCSTDCTYFKYAMEKSAEQGNTLRTERKSFGRDGRIR